MVSHPHHLYNFILKYSHHISSRVIFEAGIWLTAKYLANIQISLQITGNGPPKLNKTLNHSVSYKHVQHSSAKYIMSCFKGNTDIYR